MNALRRYLFPILLACLAFAIGIAIGGGPLHTDEGGGNSAALEQDNAALQDRISSLQKASIFDEALNQSLAGTLLRRSLVDRSVTMFVLPGVDDDLVAATSRVLVQAGASLPVVAHLDAAMIDPGKKTYVDSVARSSLKGVSDLHSMSAAGTYERAGALLARAYAGHGSSLEVDEEAVKIDSELRGAKLLTLEKEPLRRGSWVVVLAPGEHADDSLGTARTVIAHDLVSAITRGSDAVVVGSTPASSSPGGLIDALSSDPALASKRLSTVNVVDTTAGRTALVYALNAAAAGAPGSFGVDGSHAILPPGLASNPD